MRNEGPMSLKFSVQTEHDDFQKGMTLNKQFDLQVSCWFWTM